VFGNSSEARILLDAQNTGNPAVGLGLVTFEPGYETGLHRHEATEVVYVLAGRGHLTIKPGRPPREVVAGDAIYVPPGAPHALEALEPLTFLMAYGPGGAEQGLEGKPSGTTPVDPKDATKRRWPMAIVVPTGAVAPLAIGGGKGEVRILHEQATTKDATFAVSTLTAGPGMVVPPHRHDGATEVLYVLEGAATMTIAGERIDVGAGDAIQIPPGVEHGAEVAADGAAFKALQLYTPAGPEQRFKGPPP
jgi:quercetin dioxygenase-like cupin family protein